MRKVTETIFAKPRLRDERENKDFNKRGYQQGNFVGILHGIAFGEHIGINQDQQRHDNRGISDAFVAKHTD